jgi:hypothetical protein
MDEEVVMLPLHRAPACAALVAALGCASSPVSLDRFRGMYVTHFEGIPDRAAVCATLTNRGETEIEWVALRLNAYTAHSADAEPAPEPTRWTSSWVYPRRLGPGESQAIRLPNPPVAEQMELTVSRSGRGPVPPRARRAIPSERCSEAGLERTLRDEDADRTAPNIELRPIERHDDPANDPLVAAQEPH